MAQIFPPETAYCAHPGCTEPGEYRAPRSREAVSDYIWFCLAHVREYNAAWNFYEGLDDAMVEHSVREDSVWRRPTWPFGARAAEARFRDPLNLFHVEDVMDPRAAREGEAQARAMTGEERRAMNELGLTPPITRSDVKLRYKVLAKTLHPDANGGDKRAEERLKSVNHAYKTLRDSDRLP